MVIAEKTIHKYHDKAGLNKEYFEIVQRYEYINATIAYMIFTISSDIILEEDNEDWLGFVDAIKKHINKKDDGLREKMKSQSEKIEKIDKDVRKIDNDVSEIKKMLKEHIFVDKTVTVVSPSP